MQKNNKKPAVAFLGTPLFAIPILEKLNKYIEPKLVVTALADEKAINSPVYEWALKHKIPVIAPKKISALSFEKDLFDLFIVAAYGQILKEDVLSLPSYGTLNIHPSLLPKYRGASPIQSCIINGERETGVTIIIADREIDHGPILAQEKITIEDSDDSNSLSEKLSLLGGELLIKALPKYLEGGLKPVEQDHSQATFTKLLRREDGKINWREKAEKIERLVRGYKIWPTVWTEWNGVRLKIYRGYIGKETDSEPGTFFKTKDGNLAVAASDKFFIVSELQPAGKTIMNAQAFINGYGKNLLLADDV